MCDWCVYYVFFVYCMGQVPEIKLMMMMMMMMMVKHNRTISWQIEHKNGSGVYRQTRLTGVHLEFLCCSRAGQIPSFLVQQNSFAI